jgi:hypothetical protein
MLPEQPALVIQDEITTTHTLAIPTSPRILKHGDISTRHAPLNYRASTYSYSACRDSRSNNSCYLTYNRYSHC